MVIVLHQGKIVEAGSMETLRKEYQTNKIELIFPKTFLHINKKSYR